MTIWLTLTPGAGWSSKTVMTGPGLIALDRPLDPELLAAGADQLAQPDQLGLVDLAAPFAHLEEVDRRQGAGRDLGRREELGLRGCLDRTDR